MRYRNNPKVRQPCRIAVDQQGLITIIAPYNKAFVEEWQKELTRDNFEWLEKEKKYKIKPSALETCVKIAQKYFPRVEGLEDIIVSPYDTLQVAEDAPMEVCKAAHKALTIKYHPDRLNDPAVMSTILEEHKAQIEAVLRFRYPDISPDSCSKSAWANATHQFCTDLCAQYTEALTELVEAQEEVEE